MIYGEKVVQKWLKQKGNRNTVIFASSLLLMVGGYWYTSSLSKQSVASLHNRPTSNLFANSGRVNAKQKRVKPKVDKIFLKRLMKIIRMVVPSPFSSEGRHLTFLTLLLIIRTTLSIYIADMMGFNARQLVERNIPKLRWGIIKFILISFPASLVNSMLHYETHILSLKFRKRLTKEIHDKYLTEMIFYKACHIERSKISNTDQRITNDIQKFCESLSELYANTFKPVLDVILFTRKLAQNVGRNGPMLMYVYYILSSVLLRAIMPPFPKLIAQKSNHEGNFRTAHQRLITNAEEICFYGGSKRELGIINYLFHKIFKHSSRIHWLRFVVGVFDGMLVKYGASMVGYIVMCMPIFFVNFGPKKTASDLTLDYVKNTQLLLNLARGIGNLVLIYKRVTTLAGYTAQVSELFEMVAKLRTEPDHPFKIKSETSYTENRELGESVGVYHDNTNTAEFLKTWMTRRDEEREAEQKKRSQTNKVRKASGGKGGTFIEGTDISFKNVTIVSPEGCELVSDLNFTVKRHHNVMITGPNGCGKSSLFRILGELWPLHNGEVVKPLKKDIFYVPQRPYCVLGTLRDQLIYPHTAKEMSARGIDDVDLTQLMEIVDPSGRILQEWGWDDQRDWITALSGGQKQQIAMARVFYHRPLYAILDECTSAVTSEVEAKIYTTCTTLGITIFTVCHRPQLRIYHHYQLIYDGEGGYKWEKIINNNNTDSHHDTSNDEDEDDEDGAEVVIQQTVNGSSSNE